MIDERDNAEAVCRHPPIVDSGLFTITFGLSTIEYET